MERGHGEVRPGDEPGARGPRARADDAQDVEPRADAVDLVAAGAVGRRAVDEVAGRAVVGLDDRARQPDAAGAEQVASRAAAEVDVLEHGAGDTPGLGDARNGSRQDERQCDGREPRDRRAQRVRAVQGPRRGVHRRGSRAGAVRGVRSCGVRHWRIHPFVKLFRGVRCADAARRLAGSRPGSYRKRSARTQFARTRVRAMRRSELRRAGGEADETLLRARLIRGRGRASPSGHRHVKRPA